MQSYYIVMCKYLITPNINNSNNINNNYNKIVKSVTPNSKVLKYIKQKISRNKGNKLKIYNYSWRL